MNTGAEAVETALKICRKWAYEKKGIAENFAQIIVCDGNFHGRTTTIISFSNDANARKTLDHILKVLSKFLMMMEKH
jgi:ornithine--oxo-acid transaminase